MESGLALAVFSVAADDPVGAEEISAGRTSHPRGRGGGMSDAVLAWILLSLGGFISLVVSAIRGPYWDSSNTGWQFVFACHYALMLIVLIAWEWR